MRSLVNKVFTSRAIKAQEAVVRDRISHHLSRADPNEFDAVADFSALFPVEVITTMLGVPEEHRQQVREWKMTMSRAGAEAITQTGLLYYNLIQKRRAEPRDDMISSLIAAEIEREDGSRSRLDDVEIAGFATLLGGAGAETVTKLLGSAVVLFSQHRDQWEKLRALARMESAIALFEVDYDNLRRVAMTSVNGYANVGVRVRYTPRLGSALEAAAAQVPVAGNADDQRPGEQDQEPVLDAPDVVAMQHHDEKPGDQEQDHVPQPRGGTTPAPFGGRRVFDVDSGVSFDLGGGHGAPDHWTGQLPQFWHIALS